MQITIDNFEAMLPAVAHAVEGATFLAFDCEMTGLFLDTNKHAQLDDMAARYDKARPAAPRVPPSAAPHTARARYRACARARRCA